ATGFELVSVLILPVAKTFMCTSCKITHLCSPSTLVGSDGTFQHLVERGLSFSSDHRECSTDELLPRSVVFDPLWLLEIHQRLSHYAALYPQCVRLTYALDRATQDNLHCCPLLPSTSLASLSACIGLAGSKPMRRYISADGLQVISSAKAFSSSSA